jgi:cation diffusion facilitator family transporter
MAKLSFVFWLILSLALVQIGIGLGVIKSMAAAADGFHSLFDVGGIAIALFVCQLSKRKNPAERKELERKGGKAIGIIIILTALFLTSMGTYRIFSQSSIVNPLFMLLLGTLGVAANIVAVKALHEHRHDGHHIYGVYIHRLGDFASSLIVVIGAVVIMIFDVHIIDSVAAFGISLFLLFLAKKVLTQKADA